jgi:hypothetical protein
MALHKPRTRHSRRFTSPSPQPSPRKEAGRGSLQNSRRILRPQIICDCPALRQGLSFVGATARTEPEELDHARHINLCSHFWMGRA